MNYCSQAHELHKIEIVSVCVYTNVIQNFSFVQWNHHLKADSLGVIRAKHK